MNTAVSKATKHDGNSPKQKHVIGRLAHNLPELNMQSLLAFTIHDFVLMSVIALCSFSWESKVSVKNMLDMLIDRLHDSNWDVSIML